MKAITRDITHHLGHILFVRSKSQLLPTLKMRESYKVMHIMGSTLMSACHIAEKKIYSSLMHFYRFSGNQMINFNRLFEWHLTVAKTGAF